MILSSVGEITPDNIMKAKVIRADYINDQLLAEQVLKGLSNKEAALKIAKKKVKPKNLTRSHLCFRIMTYEHIPADVMANQKQANAKLSFHPFKHYSFVRGKWREVGRSHWEGNFRTGQYKQDRGKLTNKLVRSLMMLVDRFSQKGNFRNYTYLDDMKGQALMQLSHVALKFDESKSDNPFAFYTTCIKHCFIKILKEEKKMRRIRDDLITMEGMDASFSYQMENDERFGGQEAMPSADGTPPAVIAALDE